MDKNDFVERYVIDEGIVSQQQIEHIKEMLLADKGQDLLDTLLEYEWIEEDEAEQIRQAYAAIDSEDELSSVTDLAQHARFQFVQAMDGVDMELLYEESIANLENGVASLQRVLARIPQEVAIFEMLGVLYLTLGLHYDQQSRLAEALLSLERAIHHDPTLEEAGNFKEAILEEIERIRKEAQDHGEHIGETATAEHNLLTLLAEAELGLELAEEYRQSSEAQETIEGLIAAKACSLWREMGLEETGKWQQQAILLQEKASVLLESAAVDRAGLRQWYRQIRCEKALAGIDFASVYEFVSRQLLGEQKRRKVARDFAMIASHSRRRTWTKLHAAIISFMAIATIVLVLHENRQSSIRDWSYQRACAAYHDDDCRQMLEAVERFAAHPPLSGIDRRENHIRHFRQYAVQTIAEEPYLKLYEQMQQDLDRADYHKALQRAEKVSPDGTKDSRSRLGKLVYKSFICWVLQGQRRSSTEIERYRQLVEKWAEEVTK